MIEKLKSISIIYFFTIILLTGALSGCSKGIENNRENPIQSPKTSINKITPEEAKNRLDSGENIILLDVRTKEEYNAGHIKSSILIPVDNLEEEAEVILKDKETSIFVYCKSGNRSFTASKILVGLGYKNVYDLGGISSWPYEVVK